MVALFQSDSVAASARATAVQFASHDQVSVLYRDKAVQSLALTAPFTGVSGMTALYDGLAATIEAIGDGADRGQCNIVWLMSDGGENDSRKMSQNDIQKLVAAKRLAGWKFVYAWEATGGGASGADAAAADLGFDRGLTIHFAADAAVARTAVMEVVADKVKEWWAAGCPNEIAFTAKERAMVAMGLSPSVSTGAIYKSTVYVF